ncbi:MAG: FIST C-terminal domain-containing protein [Magnetospirillum sp.]|nr:FIST C-terminal domain-containing protein [Magnetospirillum sp.]
MWVEQRSWTSRDGWSVEGVRGDKTSLVIYFAAPGVMPAEDILASLRTAYGDAPILGCTTGGEILGSEVIDDSLVVSAIGFDHARVRVTARDLSDTSQSNDIGAALAKDLAGDDLKAIFILSDGTKVNGDSLVAGCLAATAPGVVVTGGLAGDGARFQTTAVGCDDAMRPGRVAAFGLYGESLSVGHGSFGGWDEFGPPRTITRSEGNILYELDGEPALDLYKRYLGEEAQGLPGSALLFPLSIRPAADAEGGEVVRTIVGIDEDAKSMIFAGDVPKGHLARLMRGNFDNLVDGAGRAAEAAAAVSGPGLALLVSCIGRKLLMGQRIAEEVEIVADVMGPKSRLMGFYSYGEISPHGFTGKCELHNQTMTITTISER